MTLEEFRDFLLEEVRSSAEAYRNFRRVSFVAVAASRLAEAEEVADFEECPFEGAGQRGRKMLVDGYCVDDVDGSISLVVADFSDSDELSTVGTPEVRRYLGQLQAFVEEALAGRLTDGSIEEAEPGFGLAHELYRRRGRLERFRLYLVTDRQLAMRAKDLPNESIDGVPAELHVWDIERFHRAHQSATGRDDLEVDFRQFGDGLPFLQAGGDSSDYTSYLCVIPGKLLADVYDHYGSRLLEGNVRSFLSVRGGVNKGIQVTIKNRPEMFFAYNNGISTTAEGVTVSDDGTRIVSARNLQIVNGGQTTASLALAQRREKIGLEGIHVQMKLSVLPGERAASLIPEIARYANSQNKINDADFFSNHPYHIRIEEFSRRLYAPAVKGAQFQTHWFYERARGQYLNEQSRLARAERSKFVLQNPKDQLLTKTDLAKLENTWRGLPHKVSLGAQKNFREFADWIEKQWTQDETEFHEEYFRRIVALAILFRATESLVTDQSWYQSGYRANIVTYTLAKLKLMIDTDGRGRRLGLKQIWDRQALSAELLKQLAVIAKRVFDTLTASDRSKENVTEWAKMEACWQRVRETSIPLDASLSASLVDAANTRVLEGSARRQQHEDNGIAIQAKIYEFGGTKWRRVKDWAMGQSLLTPKESGLLSVASDIPRKIPTEAQCAAIWKIREKLIAEGCPELVASSR